MNYAFLTKSYCLFAALVAVAGCNRSPYDVAPVHGNVTIDDKALFQGKVVFAPLATGADANPGKPAVGTINSDGTYRLTTFTENDGAVVGQHWATVVNSAEELPDGVPEFARVTLPNAVTVEAGRDNEIHLKFTRDEVRKFREDDN